MKIHPRFFRLAVSLVALALSGCVSARYKSADKDTPPPVPLNLTVAQPLVAATVNTVIIYKGSGSWKKEAFWDEYVVTVANRGALPLVVESAALTDFQGETAAPGDNPWLLEKQSRTRAEELNRATKATLVQFGTGYLMFGTSVSMAYVGAGIGGAALGIAGLAVFPAYIGGAVYRNISSRHEIENEFAHRRLMLPATVAPGGVAQGSLFFRISPGPQRLALRGRSGAEPVEVAIELTPLKGLHLLPAADTPPPATATR